MPRWLKLVATLFFLNAIAVGGSVIHRQLFAAPESTKTNSESDQPTTLLPPEESTVEVEFHPALPPPPETLDQSDKPVLEDDPLLREIRKHAASQYPELMITSAPTGMANGVNSAARGVTSSDLQLLDQRLKAVASLNQGAIQLLQIAALQQQLGQFSQADSSLAQVQQLRMLMAELLGQ